MNVHATYTHMLAHSRGHTIAARVHARARKPRDAHGGDDGMYMYATHAKRLVDYVKPRGYNAIKRPTNRGDFAFRLVQERDLNSTSEPRRERSREADSPKRSAD